MPKSKTGPALFELYNKGQGENLETERVTSKRSPIAESASAFRATLANLAKTINREGQSEKVEKSPERVAAGSSVMIDRGRLHVVLTSRMSGIVLAVLLVSAIGVFLMGQWVGDRKGVAKGQALARESIQGVVDDEIATARKSKPIQDLFAGIGTSPVSTKKDSTREKQKAKGRSRQDRADHSNAARRSPAGNSKSSNDQRLAGSSSATAKRESNGKNGSRRDVPVTLMAQPPVDSRSKPAAASSNTTWVKGLTYVIVQSFRSDALKDADKAQEFLVGQGIATEVIAKRNKPIMLIATKGFDIKNKTQRNLAGRFLKRIRAIGKTYPKVGGRYKLEGYLATLTKESW